MSDYTKQDWKDGTDGGTPITAARLAHIEDGIAGHAHSASDVTSGTLSADRLPTVPIAHGGTGATTAAAALTELGAASASDLATVRDSVSQIELVGVTSVTLNSSSSADDPYVYVGFRMATGYEFRIVCDRSTIHLDRFDPSGHGMEMWSK